MLTQTHTTDADRAELMTGEKVIIQLCYSKRVSFYEVSSAHVDLKNLKYDDFEMIDDHMAAVDKIIDEGTPLHKWKGKSDHTFFVCGGSSES